MSLAEILETMDRNELRVVELGKIKIGGKGEERKTAEGKVWRLPRKDDHFSITTMNRSDAGDFVLDAALMQDLIRQYGDKDGKLRQLPVRLLSDDLDDVLQTGWVWYMGKVRAAVSDGKTVTWHNDPNIGPDFGKKFAEPVVEPWRKEFAEIKDTRNRDPKRHTRLFKLHSILNCVIAAKESRFGGVYKFRTTSLITFKQLYASLMHVQALTGGVLMGMPLMLVVRPMQVAPEGQPTTVYVVHAELRGAGLAELQAQAVKQMTFMVDNRQRLMAAQAQYKQLLAAPGEENEDEAKDVADEFAPDMNEIPVDVEARPSRTEAIFGEDTKTAGVDAHGTGAASRGDGTGTPATPTRSPDSSAPAQNKGADAPNGNAGGPQATGSFTSAPTQTGSPAADTTGKVSAAGARGGAKGNRPGPKQAAKAEDAADPEPPTWGELSDKGITKIDDPNLGGIVVQRLTDGCTLRPDGIWAESDAFDGLTVAPNDAEHDRIARTMAAKAMK